MRKFIGLTVLLLLGQSMNTATESFAVMRISGDDAVQITIIYDNYQDDRNLGIDWGFACLVEYQENHLLFDAGRDAELYKKNLELLDIHPETIPALFISHGHGDHTAGLPWITEINPSVSCYLPSSYAQQLRAAGTLHPHSKGLENPGHLYGPFYSTGDNFAAFKEQGLVIKTRDGGVLITGCGHPGALSMISKAEKELGIEIHTLIGGLHLMSSSDSEMKLLATSLKEMGVRQICPTHCTGDKSIASLKDSFGEDYIPGGSGQVIVIQ